MKSLVWLAGLPILVAGVAHAQDHQLSITSGADYSSGKYGGSSTTTVWDVPVLVKYVAAPWTFSVYIPYLSVDGVVNTDVGKGVNTVSESQSGLGDTVVGAAYELLPRGGDFGIDVGARAKLVTADRDKDLLTTGNPDYMVYTDAYMRLAGGTVVTTLGWTKKGDIRVLDSQQQFTTLNPRDPWNVGVTYSFPLDAATSLGVSYDWRQSLFSDTDNLSEASLLLSQRWSQHWRVQGYMLAGFSDASPDWGTGVFLTYLW